LVNFRKTNFKNLNQKYTSMEEREAPNQNTNLEKLREDIEKFLELV